MLQNSPTSFFKLCPQTRNRIVFLPLATLGIVGFLINTHVSFISSNVGVCYPKTNVVFLKTHKCAGSSIQNTLMRYGDSHKLNFVLPRHGNYMGHPVPFSRALVAPPLLRTYNILAHHTRLDYSEIRAVMPFDSVYITIVRDPVQIFESSFAYYELDKFFGRDLHKFIEILPNVSETFANGRFRGKFGANQMIFDLGGDPAIFNNESLVLQYLDKLESWFHLVLVADRMDESLVLLKNLMCWDIDDVVTFKLNARNSKFKSSLNDQEKVKLQELNHADVLLYNRFLEKFEKEIEAFGIERMASEAAELRERTQQWYELCVKGEQPHTAPRIKPKYYYNPKVMVFETNKDVSNSTCTSMTMEELAYTDYLRRKQMERLPRRFKSLLRNRSRSVRRLSKLRRSKKMQS